MPYDVHLEIFEGPLDLLLYLIKKNDLEISEIPIAEITKEYLEYLEMMKDLNLDVAGEFLVMASTLMQIKARMLLPSKDEEEEEPLLEELKSKLFEYQKFKEVASVLSCRENEYGQVYYRSTPVFDKDNYTLEATIFDLLDSFNRILKELPEDVKEIVYQEIPIEQKIREIFDLLEGKDYISFYDILKKEKTKHGLVVSFLAILELIRLKQIIARQTELFAEIRVYRIKEQQFEDYKEETDEGQKTGENTDNTEERVSVNEESSAGQNGDEGEIEFEAEEDSSDLKGEDNRIEELSEEELLEKEEEVVEETDGKEASEDTDAGVQNDTVKET